MPKPLHEQLFVGDFLFEWEVEEYDQYERPRQWYIITGLLALVLIIYGILSGNFLFTLIILLAGIIIYLQSQQSPLQVPVAITEKGIIIGRRFYQYDEFQEFYIVFEPGVTKTLFLETNSLLQPRIELPIHNLDAVAVRRTLTQYIPENFEKEEEPFSEQMRKIWKLH